MVLLLLLKCFDFNHRRCHKSVFTELNMRGCQYLLGDEDSAAETPVWRQEEGRLAEEVELRELRLQQGGTLHRSCVSMPKGTKRMVQKGQAGQMQLLL